MVNNIRQNSDLRSVLKCSTCRKKKIKCTPRDRSWEETHQKCDNCQKHNDPCGPNIHANEETVSSRDSTCDPRDEPETPASQWTGIQHGELYVGKGNEEQPSMVVESSRNRRKRKLVSTEEYEPEELVDEAKRLLGELNACGQLCNFASLRTRISCHDQEKQFWNSAQDSQTTTFRNDLHELFVRICRLGSRLDKLGKKSDAERIFLKLSGALQKYPELSDDSKNAALWTMADFFRGIGDTDDIEFSPPALFNQEALHIAAAQGNEENLRALLEARAPVDALDAHKHTALFLAALKGHDGCCALLIKHRADPNSRNFHGTTILEAAAGAGHIKVVRQLVEAKAEVNPVLICCSSSPLQAAIENLESPHSIAMYLLGKKADVSIRRRDGKNAIELADNKCKVLASIMRQIQIQGPEGLFDRHQISFFRTDLQSGPAFV
ncbi:ankyrin repeat-containing domain protein [Usnea florida]